MLEPWPWVEVVAVGRGFLIHGGGDCCCCRCPFGKGERPKQETADGFSVSRMATPNPGRFNEPNRQEYKLYSATTFFFFFFLNCLPLLTFN